MGTKGISHFSRAGDMIKKTLLDFPLITRLSFSIVHFIRFTLFLLQLQMRWNMSDV